MNRNGNGVCWAIVFAACVALPAWAQDEGAADEGPGLPLYLGVEYASAKVDLSKDSLKDSLGGDEFDTEMFVLRGGVRLFEVIGAELQLGAGGSASTSELEVKQYIGAYFVPTGTVGDTVEVSARFGYSFLTVEGDTGGEEDLDGASFGVGAELPIRAFGEGLPNLRITFAGTVYQGVDDARIYGWSGGLRYDFSL